MSNDNVTRLPQKREVIPVMVCIPTEKVELLKQIGALDIKGAGHLDIFRLLQILTIQERTQVRRLIFRRVLYVLAVSLAAVLLGRFI
jgi:hypothetical protein